MVLLVAFGKKILEKKLPGVRIEELKAVGSWIAFSKERSYPETGKCKLEYLPVAPLPPHDNIVKWYMDNVI